MKRKSRSISSTLSKLRSLASNTRAAAAVEFALSTPLFLALMLGAVDVTVLLAQRTDMFDAVQAGAQYFMVGGKDVQLAKSTVDDMWESRPETSALTVERFCECSFETHACLANCPDGSQPISYYRVSAEATYRSVIFQHEFATDELVRTR